MYGWHRKILVVDLTSGTFQEEALPGEVAHTWLGGRGLGTYWLYHHLEQGIDPLGADNHLVFAAGPLAGTRAPASGRVSASTKSPLTGTVFDSNAGGAFGVRLKSCGYEALVVTGRSASPVYLKVSPGTVSLEPAEALWGQDTRAAHRHLAGAGGPGSSVVCIGPAGENLVRFASVAVDGRRSLGRGGLGAVMGAKGLKGIVARGNMPTAIADPEGAGFVCYEMEKVLKANPVTSQALPEFGTAVLVNLLNQAGAWPAGNFRQSSFSGAEAISGEALAGSLMEKRFACYRCPIGCGRLTRTSRDRGEGPEYESIWALGANLGVEDLQVIAEANYLCNRLGLDTISTGGTLACAAELGLEADFGRPGVLLDLIEKIAFRRGVGDELAEGSRRLAEKYGRPELAMQVKGLELPAYDPRGLKGQGLAYATSNRGGCHLRANMLGPEILGTPKRVNRFAWAGKAGLVIVMQHTSAVLDSLVMCKFTSFALGDEHYARLLTRVTGEEYRPQDLQVIGERVWNLERLFNLREGFARADDTLPPRLTSTPVSDGPGRGQIVELEPMLGEYYRFREWDEHGRPTPAKLARLGLTEVGSGGDAV
ncbi:MAG: aldehyde ferredoxin oxidoreductase [Clostridia bacterium]|nr:MAG: aldehyde ferredoxin oxidoreductase [Clostridia bacterium]